MTRPTDALQRLRRVHEEAVLDALRSSGALSRTELINRTGLSRTTLFAIISEMVERGAVVEVEAPVSGARGRGRPATLVALSPEAGQLVGLDLARHRVHLAVANVSHQIIATGMEDVPEDAGVTEQAEAAVRLIRRVIGERGVRLGALEAIGLGLVGVMDDPALPAGIVPARYTPVTERLEREFGVRVAVDNNARLAALAENTWGAARSVDDMVYVRWSVGVGGGFIVGGRLVRGAHGAAGEIGHVSLDPDGPACHCGSRGCLERRIGGRALLESCAARGVRLADLDALVGAAQDRVPEVCELIAAAAADLGRILADTVVQLDPERVVVGGELASLGSLVLEPIRAAIARLSLPNSSRAIEVTPADLGVNASAMGAIALLLHEEPAIPAHLRPASG
ncbi:MULTISPECIES: ROK family transcriptional regulator [Streptosporangium]|uniref:NBD/HSP70 family sugar kinase n=1 Tax=Streptosporangium brasiliense TaxID=47480 RepID=A0ABT9RK95_9ACTN|nr:ROK family transcriptional regulator [Streptosporangium brasiliense]MDP9869727.1 putative NBD/HSP70 family sugar kinase [Streptosporangium brasiliense]